MILQTSLQILFALGALLALWMLKRSVYAAGDLPGNFRDRLLGLPGYGSAIKACIYAFLAPVTVWLFLTVLWNWFIGDEYANVSAYPWQFWLVLWVGIVAMVLSVLIRGLFLGLVWLCSLTLVVWLAASTPWFWGEYRLGEAHHLWFLPLDVALSVLVTGLVVTLLAMSFMRPVATLVLAVLVFENVHWESWGWLAWLKWLLELVFWPVVLVAVFGFAVYFLAGPIGRWLAHVATRIAAAIVVILLVLTLLSELTAAHDADTADNGSEVVKPLVGVPEAIATATHTDGLTAYLDASASKFPKGDEIEYVWILGNRKVVHVAYNANLGRTNPKLIYRYARPGKKDVVVKVIDHTNGQTDYSDTLHLVVSRPKTKIIFKERSVCNAVVKCGGSDGFQRSQLTWGRGTIPNSPSEASTLAFTPKPIKNRLMLNTFLHSDNRKAVMVRTRSAINMRQAGVSESQITSCLQSSENWIFVAPTVASKVLGTTFPVNGRILRVSSARGVAANDATWFCVGNNGRVIASSAIRADCMNPGGTSVIMPLRRHENPPPIMCIQHCQRRHFRPVHHRTPASHQGSCTCEGSSFHHSRSHTTVCQPTARPGSMYFWAHCQWNKSKTTTHYKLDGSQFTSSTTDNKGRETFTHSTSGATAAPSNTKVQQHEEATTPKGSNSGSTTGSGTTTGGGSDGSVDHPVTNPPADAGGGSGNTGGTFNVG
jgi:hypothetical protein